MIAQFGAFRNAEPSRRAPPEQRFAVWPMSGNGANPKRENARVAAAMWERADSYEESAPGAV